MVKVETLEGIRERMARKPEWPVVLCGDFNLPFREEPDGTVITFGQDRNGRVRNRLRQGDRWDKAERSIVPGLAEVGLADVFRSLHGYSRSESSWIYRASGRKVGFRLDHVFASEELTPVECTYRHEWRESGLSDHSAIEVEFSA